MNRLISLIALLTLSVVARPTAVRATPASAGGSDYNQTEIRAYFASGQADINPALERNRVAFSRIDSLLTTVSNDSSWVVNRISITGSASPEGSASLNSRLAHRRADALSRFFASYTDELSVPTDFEYIGANWEGLRALVADSPDVPERDAVSHVLTSGTDSDRLSRLKAISGGAPYRWLLTNLFPELRTSTVTITLHREKAPETILARPHTEIIVEPEPEPEVTVFEPEPEPQPIPEPSVEVQPEVIPEPVDSETFVRKLYIKTNAVGWVMAITNIAFEFDLLPHFSATLPLYYSAWEYGSHKVKFRTCAFQPELRLWTRPDNAGFFAGAHFGVAQFNMALGGRLRFQDHNGHNPALGGGLSVGYRRPLGRSQRWKLEFSLGAGVYSLYYDAFDNSSVAHGQKLYEKHKTFIGIDNVGVTFAYTIPLIRKGGQ